MSNLTLVNDALSLVGVLLEGRDATAEQGTLALRIADNTVAEWADDGILIPWESDATLDGDCPLAGAELNALKYMTAVKLCPHYGRDPSQSLIALAASAFNRLVRQQLNRELEASDALLPCAEGAISNYDIETGGFE